MGVCEGVCMYVGVCDCECMCLCERGDNKIMGWPCINTFVNDKIDLCRKVIGSVK